MTSGNETSKCQRLLCGCVDVLVAMDRITAYSCTIQTIFQLLAHLFAVAEDHGPIFPATFLRDILGGMSQHIKLSHSQHDVKSQTETFRRHLKLIRCSSNLCLTSLHQANMDILGVVLSLQKLLDFRPS